MRDKPEGVQETDLVSTLADGWGVEIRSLDYLPVGAGSYHWAAVDDGGQARFVTVDDLGDEGDSREATFALGRAFDTALALHRDAGLDFVVAPVATQAGSTVWRLGARHAMTVFPMVEGVAGRFGAHRPQDRPAVLELLVKLHQATPVVAAEAPRADLILPGRDKLQEALNDLDQEWTGGPFSEPARRAGARRHDGLDRHARRTAPRQPDPRRGRPAAHRLGNRADRPAGTGSVDARRRADDDDVLDRYTRATGRPVSPAGLALYRLWWDLDDIAIFVDELRGAHRATEDITASWKYLNGYLA